MSRPIPPLAAIRAFEAAARLMSFTRAAEELGMTQAAVSYQVKLLEERLGEPLFLRRPRELVLTEAGQRLAPRTTEAFEILRDAYGRFSADAPATLTISTTHTFASHWLAPRLGTFQLRYPQIAARLETAERMVDFAADEVDVGIRSGLGNWPGLATHRLFGMRFTPMLSPRLAESVGGIHTPADILKLPLLDPKDPWWLTWLAANDLPADILTSQTLPSLNVQALDAAAAIEGHGVTLLTPAFFRRELAAGSLIQPFERVVDEGKDFWLVYPEGRRNVPKIKAFREWIVAEAEGED